MNAPQSEDQMSAKARALGFELAHPIAITKTGDHGVSFVDHEYGLNKRELFAAMAMQGTIARPDGFETPANVAQYAVECADALLKELAK